METSQSPQSTDEISWDGFIKSLINRGIKPKIARWHVIRAEQFLKDHAARNVSELTAEDINYYLQKLGREQRLTNCQFRQAVEAIRLLFPYKSIHMENKVDWDFWLNSSSSLSPEHRTIAREQGSSNHVAVNPIPPSEPASYGRQAIEDLILEIRRRHYAISTEHTYTAWLRGSCSFITVMPVSCMLMR